MLQFNYVSALLRRTLDGEFMAQLGELPVHLLLGGGVLGGGGGRNNYISAEENFPGKTFLGLYTGQLGRGLVLDAVQHQSVAPEKLIGV